MRVVSAFEVVTFATIHPSIEFSPTVKLVSEVKPNLYLVEEPLPKGEIEFLNSTTPETEVVVNKLPGRQISTTHIIKEVIDRYSKKKKYLNQNTNK